jgi:hypothetical protein
MITITKADAMRASVAGGKAASVRRAAEVLFDAGGRNVLPSAVQEAVRGVVEREATSRERRPPALPPPPRVRPPRRSS